MRKLLAVGCAVVLFAACGGGSGGGGSSGGGDVAFHGEAPVLPGFSYDTGLQPGSGPAQISFKLAATGSHVVDTAASRNGGKLVGKAGAGTFKLDMHVKLEGHLKVDAGSVKYDGDVPGLKNVDIPITGTSPFDGLLLEGDPVKVNADVPETKLPDIPLGSVPGHLSLTIATGTHITSTFHGTCLAVKGGQANFTGARSTSGTIVLKSAIVLDIPLVKPIDLPPITVNVPQTNAELDAAPVKVDGADDASQGTCDAQSTSSSSGASSSGASSSGASSSGASSSGASSSGSSSGSSSSGSSSGSSGDGGSDSGSVASATLNGVDLTVLSAEFFQMQGATAQLDIKVAGGTVPDGTDFFLDVTHVGSTCTTNQDDVWYRRGAPDYNQYTTSGASCGLDITSVPTAPGEHATGAFHGILYGINQVNGQPVPVSLTFDIVR